MNLRPNFLALIQLDSMPRSSEVRFPSEWEQPEIPVLKGNNCIVYHHCHVGT
jgi:hypothetical protein